MTADTPQREDKPHDASKRSRTRRNVIRSSDHRDEYEALMKLGWSSESISRLAYFRWGEDIPGRTIRLWRKRNGWDVIRSEIRGKDIDPEAILDIMAERTELIRLQKERIAIDTEKERQLGRTFSSTRLEIQAANGLINDLKADMQDYGFFPKLGEIHRVQFHGSVQGVTGGEQPAPKPDTGKTDRHAPPAPTLGALLGGISEEEEQQLARMLHSIIPDVPVKQLENGHIVDAELVDDDEHLEAG